MGWEGGVGCDLLMGKEFPFGVMKCSKIDSGDGSKTVNILKTVWYVNYISIKYIYTHI